MEKSIVNSNMRPEGLVGFVRDGCVVPRAIALDAGPNQLRQVEVKW